MYVRYRDGRIFEVDNEPHARKIIERDFPGAVVGKATGNWGDNEPYFIIHDLEIALKECRTMSDLTNEVKRVIGKYGKNVQF